MGLVMEEWDDLILFALLFKGLHRYIMGAYI
jgi:hypothetical protein